MTPIEIQRVGAQGQQQLKLEPGAQLRLQSGETLTISQQGVQTQRRGSDLVLLVPGDDGQWQQVVVADFFKPGLLAQVLVQEPGAAVQVLSPQSANVSDEAPPSPRERAQAQDEAQLQAQTSSATVNASVVADLRIEDTRAQLLQEGAQDAGTASASQDLMPAVAQVGAAPELKELPPLEALQMLRSAPVPPEPLAPSLNLPSLALQHQGLPAVNLAAAQGGPVFGGTADPYARVQLTLTDAAGRSVQRSADADASGQWQAGLNTEQWQQLQGSVSVSAQAFNSIGTAGPASAAQSLYVDVLPPAAPTAQWPAAAHTMGSGLKALNLSTLNLSTLNLSTLNLSTLNAAQEGTQALLKGTAEAGSTVSVQLVTEQGRFSAQVQADDQGLWRWSPTAEQVTELTQSLGSGSLAVTAQASDALGNTSAASQALQGWWDVTPPPAATLVLPDVGLSTEQGLPVYNRSALGQAWSGTAEAGAQVRLSVIDASGKERTLASTVADANGWSAAITEAQWRAAGAADGQLSVKLTSVDEAGNTSGLSQALYFDISAPTAPTLELPDLGRVIEGVSVYNRAALDAGLAFGGKAEALSQVLLTLSDAQGDSRQMRVRADAQGQWQYAPDAAQWTAWMQSGDAQRGPLSEGLLQISVQALDAGGNLSAPSAQRPLYLDITAPQVSAIAPPLDALQIDGQSVINRLGVHRAAAFTGQAEALSRVNVQLVDSTGRQIGGEVLADEQGRWSLSLSEAQMLELADGLLQVSARATDRFGNTGAPLAPDQAIALYKSAPPKVAQLGLDAASDSGNGESGTDADRLTRVREPMIRGQAQPDQTVRIWLDADGDGLVGAAEAASLVSVQNDASGAFSAVMAPLAGDGLYTFTAVAVDRWGNASNWAAGGTDAARAATLSLSLDTQATGLRLDALSGDDRISDVELNATGVTLSGLAEAGAMVRVQVIQGGVLLDTYETRTPASGVWSLSDFGKNMGLKDGQFDLRASQIDLAGNTASLTRSGIAVRVTPLAAPGNVQIDDASNSNLLADAITNVATPRLIGQGPLGTGVLGSALKVAIFEDSQLLGRVDLVDGRFAWQVPEPLADGLHKLRFQVQDPDSGSVSAQDARLELLIDTQVQAPEINPVAGDDYINATEFSEGVAITGTVEPGATVSLVLRAGGTELGVAPVNITYVDVAGGQRQWRYAIDAVTAAILGEGSISAIATQKDLAGNDSALLAGGAGQARRSFTLNRSLLPAPTLLDLLADDDSGASDQDNITARASVRLTSTVATPGLSVHVFDDIDGDGIYTVGKDALLGSAPSNANGQVELTLSLSEGVHRLRAWSQDANGRQSLPNAAMVLTVDQSVAAVGQLQVAADQVLNAAEAAAGTSISGQGEAQASVALTFRDAAGQPKLTLDGINVGGDGTWSVALSAAQVSALGADGSYTVHAVQTDRAGNVAPETVQAFVLDTQGPRAPTGSELSGAAAVNAAGPWSDAEGISWGDLYQFNTTTGRYEPRTVSLHVALPTDPAQGAGLAQAGDALTLTWGRLRITRDAQGDQLRITQADLDRGHLQVQLSGSQIEQAGVFSGLDVTAQLQDAAGNQSQAYVVLPALNQPLSAQAPTLSLPDALQNPANPGDSTWYSNRSHYSSSGQPGDKAMSFAGQAEPGTQVEFGYLNAQGLWSRLGLGTADTSTGQWREAVFMPADMTDGLYPLQSRIQVLGGQYLYSDVVRLSLDTGIPAAPAVVQTDSTLAGDGYVNASERSAVALSGSAEPWAQVSVQLVNLSTGVAGSVRSVRADAAGQWSRPLGVVDWGQVGEGRIELRLWQTDLAGNSSLQMQSGQLVGQTVRTVLYDASVLPPDMLLATGDGYINAQEAAGAVKLTGSGEPGATLSLLLSGSLGNLPVFSLEVGSNGTWALDLSAQQVTQLGQGTVNAVLSQVDKAGNASRSASRSFVIDTQVAAPSIDETLASDNIINASEKLRGASLSGAGEAGASVSLSLSDANGQRKSFKTAVGSSGRYSLQLSASDLDGLADGTLTLRAQQTDAAGNTSAPAQRSLGLQAAPLTGAVTLDPVSLDERIALSEQSAPVRLQGSAPPQTLVRLLIEGSKGSLDLSPTLVDGLWWLDLSPAQMQTLGQGALRLQLWADDGVGNTTAVLTRQVLLESAVRAPTLDGVATDGIINALEAAASAGVALSGKGTAGHVLSLEFTGASGRKLTRAAVVAADGSWSASALSQADVQSLGEGALAVRLWQKTSSAASDADPNQASVVVSQSLTIDTVAPALPGAGSTALVQANFYNANNSAARDGQISLAESQAGVTLAIPVRNAQGALTVGAGDRLAVLWGDSRLDLTLGEADISSIGKGFLHYVTVPPSLIAQQGSGTHQVRVLYTDAAGNSSAPLTLINSLVVVAPPPAPLLNTVDGDGYVNRADHLALGASGSVLVSGSTASSDGTVSLLLARGSGADARERVFDNVAITSSGNWQVGLRAADLDALGEGPISIRASFVRTADGARSPAANGGFVFDKTLPDAPSAIHQARADQANAISELAGGLIRMGGGATEAAQTVPVRVALPANAQAGDKVTLQWGSDQATVNALVSTTDLQAGYVLVGVPPALMASVGDSNELQVSAFFTDAAGNTGAVQSVWTGKVDALPLPATLSATAFGDWLNVTEAQDASGWLLTGTSADGAQVQLTLSGSSGQTISRSVSANGADWQLALDAADAALLGDGAVRVSVVQLDDTGNRSSAVLGDFSIDLTPPPAPQLNAPAPSLTYAQTQTGQTFGGTAEAGASVTVRFAQGANQVLLSGVADSRGQWQVQLKASDFATLSANGATGAVTLSATQSDVAGNDSAPSAARSFTYRSEALAAPAFTVATGLLLDGSDRIINLADVDYAHANPRPLQISGTSKPETQVQLVLTVASQPSTFTVPVSAGGAWTLSLTEAQFNALGQGTASVQASTRELDAQGNLLNESVSTSLTLGGASSFEIDTLAPSFLTPTVRGTGLNGNAKAGDFVEVVLTATEALNVTGTPELTIEGFAGSPSSRQAIYDASASAALGPNRMVLRYEVQPGDAALAANLSVTGGLQLGAGVAVTDAAGNPAVFASTPQALVGTVQVDTESPSLPTLLSVDAQGAGTAGAAWINLAEAEATVGVSISLTGTGAVAGDALQLLWVRVPDINDRSKDVVPATPLTQEILAADITRGSLSVQVPRSLIGLMQGSAAIGLQLRDQAGNTSGYTTEHLLAVDTLVPGALGVNAWMGDNRINQAEAGAVTALGGTLLETDARIEARLVQGSTSLSLADSAITRNPNGSWSLQASALQGLISAISDGAFSIDVRQIDARGNPGSWTSTAYYKDTSPPNAPGMPQVPKALDGWINARDVFTLDGNNKEVAELHIQVTLTGTGALAGDTVRVRGLPQEISAIISGDDVARGFISITPDPSLVKQGASDAPLNNLRLVAEIEDRGGNLSPPSAALLTGLDTNVAQPLVTLNTVIDGISPGEASAPQTFTGSGIEEGASVSILITGSKGKTLLLLPTVLTDGSYSATLTPGDFVMLQEGVASYKVQQTDRAGNVSEEVIGSFNISLSTAAPVMVDFAGDNVVGTADTAREWQATQTLRGSADPLARIDVDIYVLDAQGASQLAIAGRSATADSSGQWTLDISAADFTTLTAQAGRGNFDAYFSATASALNTAGQVTSTSKASTHSFKVWTSSPAVHSSVTRFDGNGDGANNDGLQISFTEPVRVKDLSSLATAFTGVTWGTGARIEAVNPSTFNGQQFASAYRIYLGTTSTSLSSLTIDKEKVVNIGGNKASDPQSFLVPDLSTLAAPVPPFTISSDNAINFSEKQGVTTIRYTHGAISANEILRVYVDGVWLKDISPVVGSTQTDVTLEKTEWGQVDGVYAVTVQRVESSGRASFFSSPKLLNVDTALDQGGSLIWFDMNGNSAIDQGDRMTVTFQEAVKITDTGAGMPSALGTGASIGSVNAVNGFAASWNITMGANPSLSAASGSITFKGVTDRASNGSTSTTASVGDLTVNVPVDLVNTPQITAIGNVTSDNVINATEAGVSQSITLSLSAARAGDVVKLYIDGVQIGDPYVVGDVEQGSQSLVVSVPGHGWGGDGDRLLGATIERTPGGAVGNAPVRQVYVAADTAHWSALGNTIWWDPNSESSLTDGVWNSVVGSVNTSSPDTAKPSIVRMPSGSNMAMFTNSRLSATWLDSTNGINLADKSSLAVFTVLQVSSTSDQVMLHLGNTPNTSGYAINPYLNTMGGYLWTSRATRAQAPNSLSLFTPTNVALDAQWSSTSVTDTLYVNGQFSAKATNGSTIVQNTNLINVLTMGASGANSYRGQSALMGDVIIMDRRVSTALRQEIDTYMSIKYSTLGSSVTTAAAGVYDLATNSAGDVLIAQVLDRRALGSVSDAVVISGSDWVNTGAGTDTVKAKDLAFRTLDGGMGRDTFALDADYADRSNIVLADFVSNARGMGSDTLANERVNAAGFHKLQGFEVIDVSTHAARQVLTVAAADVNQLSETHTLETRLGTNDVLVTQGLSLQRGAFKINDQWYDSRYSATVDGQSVALYSMGGDETSTLSGIKWASGNQLLQIGLDHAMPAVVSSGGVSSSSTSQPLVGDFAVTTLSGAHAWTVGAVATLNQSQGVQLSLSMPDPSKAAEMLGLPIKVKYTPTSSVALLDETGRGFASSLWLIGTDQNDSGATSQLDARLLSTAEQDLGVVLIGGKGADVISGGRGADTLIGGMEPDILTGGAGADTFRFVNETAGAGADGDLGGTVGDAIKDFNFGVASGVADGSQADRLDLRDLFAVNFSGNAAADAAQLVSGGYLDVIRAPNASDPSLTDWKLWVDRDGKDASGASAFGLMATLENVQLAGSPTSITGSESTSELLQKMLAEGRLVVAHA